VSCSLPPELDDHVLLAYLGGYKVSCDADQAIPMAHRLQSPGNDASQVAAHLRQCPYCRERARSLARVQDDMTAQLYRITCPDPTELGEYHLGVLPLDRTKAVAEHLAECPHCRREVAQLTEYLAELEPSPRLDPLDQVVQRIRVLVARLVSGRPLGQPALSPAFASLRGGEQEPLIYEAGEVQVMIEIQEDADRPDRSTILGLVIGSDAPQELKAHLWAAEQRLATVPVDELGNFVLSNVLCGSYELMLSGPEIDIHIQDLEIGPG